MTDNLNFKIMMELKILIYWVIIVGVFRVIAFIEHRTDAPYIYFKYYDGFFTEIFRLLLYIGYFVITMWVFIQFTSYFFTNEFILISKQ
jgi:hypothetical protein